MRQSSKKNKNLTVIANDTGFPGKGVGRLVVGRQVKKVIASHIGTNPETGKGVVALIVTEFGVIRVMPKGLVLEEVYPGVTAEEVCAKTEASLIVSKNLSPMKGV